MDLPGFQIDMIIERADRMVHLCEMKFSRNKYGITARYEDQLRERMGAFELATGTKQSLVHTFITTYGVVDVKALCIAKLQWKTCLKHKQIAAFS